MNRPGGFTLVELVITIFIFGFLMALGAPAFNTWQKKHAVEGQIEKLYSDLQFSRMKAYAEKVASGVCLQPEGDTGRCSGGTISTYEMRSDRSSPPNGNIIDAGDVNGSSRATLKYPVTSSMTTVTFDTRGLANSLGTLSLSPNYGASIDCISVSKIRLRIGKMNASGTCEPK